MDPLAEYALRKPGALLIRRDPSGFRDEAECGYEIGVQLPRQHVRFANVFLHAGRASLYVKHDPLAIDELYRAEPERVVPSEIASKHWSQVLVGAGAPEPWMVQLIDRSYELVVEKASKAGRAALVTLAGQANAFLHFHELAMSLQAGARVYHIPETPELSADGRPVAYFSWNRLRVKPSQADEQWAELGVDRLGEWRSVLSAAVRRALDGSI